MKGLSPTQRTLRELRSRGLKAGIVEKFNQHAGPFGIRQDLFGIIDIIALDFGRGVVGIQSTGQDFSGHMKKMHEEHAQDCVDWLRTPGAVLELWGWRKLLARRGGKQQLWTPRIHVFTIEEFINHERNEDAEEDAPEAGGVVVV